MDRLVARRPSPLVRKFFTDRSGWRILLMIGAVNLAATGAAGQVLRVEHIAGTIGGGGSADGVGAAVRFSGPAKVASNSAGTAVFVADSNNNTIRRIDAATGAVTTLAGKADLCGSADGVGAAARFCGPAGIAADAAGSVVFVADTPNHTIRRIDVATGTVTTLAGLAGHAGSTDGTGSAARFYNPRGLAVDAAGTTLFVADMSGRTIRHIDVATAAVTTLAGLANTPGYADGVGSAARFNRPYGVATDAAGTMVYVADREDNTIRAIVVSTQTVTTLAGQHGVEGQNDGVGTAAHLRRPTDVALDASATTLYVADSLNNELRTVNTTTGAVVTVAGVTSSGTADGIGSAARFHSDSGVAVGASGTVVFVADTGNNTIRRFEVASSTVTTLAGLAAESGAADGTGTAARFLYPSGIAIDGAGGTAYVADSGNNTIRKIQLASGVVTTLAGAPGAAGYADGIGSIARFYYPEKVAVDAAGTTVFVADSGNNVIRKIDVATTAVTTLAGLAGVAGSDDGAGSGARFNYPAGIAANAAGTIVFVGDLMNNTIRRIDVATGTVTTLAGQVGVAGTVDGAGSAAQFDFPYGVAADAAGTTLFVADYNNHTIRRIDVGSATVSTLAGSAGISGSADGVGTAALFSFPGAVALDGAGTTLFIADSGNDLVRRVAVSSGKVSAIAGLTSRTGAADGIGRAARFNALTCVAPDASGRVVFVSDTNNHAIRAGVRVGMEAGDFDGDGWTDVAVYRPASGTWFSLDSSADNQAYRYRGWGVQGQGDTPVRGDFDGDGILDPVVFRPATGTWFILKSASNYADWQWFGWGTSTDTLVPGDYDGDGVTDAAVYRPLNGTWYIRPSSGAPPWQLVFGQTGDIPVPADYDGDGKTDIAVYRSASGTWFVVTSSSNYTGWYYEGWGVDAQGDVPVPADFDGDGRADPAVYRAPSGTWFILESHANYTTWNWFGWGNNSDTLVPGDYDGDGISDAAVYRSSSETWFVRPSSGATPWNVVFGAAGDIPLQRIR
jgi:DNA-binding beta-propeller fold protein YncE